MWRAAPNQQRIQNIALHVCKVQPVLVLNSRLLSLIFTNKNYLPRTTSHWACRLIVSEKNIPIICLHSQFLSHFRLRELMVFQFSYFEHSMHLQNFGFMCIKSHTVSAGKICDPFHLNTSAGADQLLHSNMGISVLYTYIYVCPRAVDESSLWNSYALDGAEQSGRLNSCKCFSCVGGALSGCEWKGDLQLPELRNEGIC